MLIVDTNYNFKRMNVIKIEYFLIKVYKIKIYKS